VTGNAKGHYSLLTMLILYQSQKANIIIISWKKLSLKRI